MYNPIGTASATETPIGNMRPYALTATCGQPTRGTTVVHISATGPAARLDGLIDGTSASVDEPAFNHTDLYPAEGTTTSTPVNHASDTLWIPATGTPIETLATVSVVGGSTNTCHFSAVVVSTR